MLTASWRKARDWKSRAWLGAKDDGWGKERISEEGVMEVPPGGGGGRK